MSRLARGPARPILLWPWASRPHVSRRADSRSRRVRGGKMRPRLRCRAGPQEFDSSCPKDLGVQFFRWARSFRNHVLAVVRARFCAGPRCLGPVAQTPGARDSASDLELSTPRARGCGPTPLPWACWSRPARGLASAWASGGGCRVRGPGREVGGGRGREQVGGKLRGKKTTMTRGRGGRRRGRGRSRRRRAGWRRGSCRKCRALQTARGGGIMMRSAGMGVGSGRGAISGGSLGCGRRWGDGGDGRARKHGDTEG